MLFRFSPIRVGCASDYLFAVKMTKSCGYFGSILQHISGSFFRPCGLMDKAPVSDGWEIEGSSPERGR